MTSFERLLAGFDSRPERRGREFERLCQWLLRTAPEYRGQLREVWLWDEWPGRWAADAGIDLVALTVGGELWAVQAKAYDAAYRVKKADVDSFLSESARAEFSYRLLIATTDLIGSTARRTLAGQEKPAGLLLRSQLAQAEVRWPTSLDDLAPKPQLRKKARRHQREAVKSVLAGFRSAERGQAIMACGTGKTLVGLLVAEGVASERTLVLVPSLSLLAQTLREWSSSAERRFDYLAVCSDETVVGEDAVVSTTSELGFPVTTDPAAIASFLAPEHSGLRVVFATYQSSPRIAEAFLRGAPFLDLVIADEAHRCAGPAAGSFATVLDDRRIKARRRLFMTATPRYFTGRLRREAEEADFEVASMDDEASFGTVFHRLSFGEAIARDLLSDYQIVVVGVSDSTYREYAQRGVFVTADGTSVTDARTLASQLGLLRAMAVHDLRRVVSFHSRITSARAFSNTIADVFSWLPQSRRPTGQLRAAHVSGRMSSGERDRRLDELRRVGKDERGLLSNARCLAEGVDVPTLDGVAFIEPRRSQIDIVQAVGRAIRKAPDKTIGTIVIPVFVDEDADPEQAIEASAFERVWQVVKALRAHDDALADELDELRRELGRRTTTAGQPAKLKLDLPVAVDESFARAFDVRLVTETTAAWEFWFGLLQRYAERVGHARVLQTHAEDGFKLGTWVAGQRDKYRAGALDPERARLLETTPGWVWHARASRWEQGLRHLDYFVEREGHALVPAGHTEDGFKLGVWVGTQRSAYQRGVLAPDRAKRLEALPGWSWDQLKSQWDESFDHLIRFVRREGHARVPEDHIEDGFKLGHWVHNQRARSRAGTLSAERTKRLESLPGWTAQPHGDAWEIALAYLTRFVEQHGHARVPKSHVEDGFKLGDWVNLQRAVFRRGKLEPARIAQLEQRPGWVWNAREVQWEDALLALQRFAEREGHARVHPRHVEDDLKLGVWVNVQRTNYQGGKLSPERIAKLEAVPGWIWVPRGTDWEDGFAFLARYVQREGHARVPQDHIEDDFRLGGWVTTQRQRYRQGKLDPSRAARLADLHGWAWNPHDVAWEQGLQHLLRYVERERHARVPESYSEGDFALGRWVSKKRQAFKRGRLAPDRAKRLEKLPGWTWRAR